MLPKIAIGIDDLGYDRPIAQECIDFQAPLTLSFLPQAPHAKEMALLASKKGKETLLHLPMEPLDFPKTNPGPGALFLSMSATEITQIIDNDFNEFYFVQGANNHMGSRFTENREKMAVVFESLKKRGLFFLDSLTTAQSVVPAVAEDLGLKYLQRNIFLDNEVAEGPIKQQLERLIQVAQARGFAIGVGHPYPLLLQIIRDRLPYLKDKVEIVSLSELIK
ncbi:MAG TPA: divergent polysaccharide deacetylase family protein [Thermodesulfobacteriota bacterium]|nr:divergent polysaccharide deacetylase family protein [Thermodesulfobacteriota bacterium]